jgi:predicted dehydrogenase
MGRHHVRLTSQMKQVELVGVYDAELTASEPVAQEFGVRSWPSLGALAGEIEAAIVAAPTAVHAEIACDLLNQGIHVLVEKPLASTLEEADRILAAAGECVVAVGHVEFYNPAVQALLELGSAPGFVEVHRLASFSPRSLDVDVVLDLMIHDLQILHALDPSPVAEVRATGIEVLSPNIDLANARIALASGCVANITASRVSAERVRKLRVILPNEAYFSLDYQKQEVKGYRLSEEKSQRGIVAADLEVVPSEPLKHELESFFATCQGGSPSLVDGQSGRRALKTALAVAAAAAG